MRIFLKFYKKLLFILSLKFFIAADADFQTGIHGPFDPTETARPDFLIKKILGPIGKAYRTGS